MREYGFLLTRIFPHKDRICNSALIRENKGGRIRVSENPYSRIFYVVQMKIAHNLCFLIFPIITWFAAFRVNNAKHNTFPSSFNISDTILSIQE